MGSEWHNRKIGELGRVVTGKTPSTADASNFGDEFPFITIPDLNDGVYVRYSARMLSSTGAEAIKSCRLPSGSVLMSCIATIGKTGITTRDSFTNQQINALICNDNIFPPFVYYSFQLLSIELHDVGSGGSVFANVSKSRFSNLNIQIPDNINDQITTVSVLESLDEKIALLRETNATLEAIAQAIFKSWFVDFDPVRAKAEGCAKRIGQPSSPMGCDLPIPEGVPPEVADLFPSEFEDSELGAIPKGWRVATFQELTEVLGGSTPSTKDPMFWEEGVHYWATPKDLSGMDTPVLLETERKITDTGLEKISSGLLPIGTVLLSSRAPIGYLAIAEVPVAINQGFIAMKARRGVSNLFLLRMVQARMDDIKSRANGSTFLEISKGAFRPIPVLVPPSELIQVFDGLVRPLYLKLVENQRERATLTELRDSLLPRLMSGKLRIPLGELVEVSS